MSVATVKLRTDLLVSRHGAAEKSFFVIKDPEAERFFRFGETEHFIAQQLDGATGIDTVRQRVEERFGVSPSPGRWRRLTSGAAALAEISFISVAKPSIPTACLIGWRPPCRGCSRRRSSCFPPH